MSFTKLLIQSTFDKVPTSLTHQPKENCPASNCTIYPTPPCKDMPRYLPQQVPPYYDKADPNSIIKYRPWPVCKEKFEQPHSTNTTSSTLITIIVLLIVLFLIHDLSKMYTGQK